ncbi:unnamed protein product, partial [Knipowitschia caucasica]
MQPVTAVCCVCVAALSCLLGG